MQRLAFLAGQELIVQNMSLQTDSSDLLGGYRPLEIKQLARPIYVSFVELFVSQFSKSKNTQFLDYIYVAYEKQQWKSPRTSNCFSGSSSSACTALPNAKAGLSLRTWPFQCASDLVATVLIDDEPSAGCA